MGEINSLPALRHQPDGTQAMPVGDQHRCSVAMGRCVGPGAFDEPVDPSVGRVFARPLSW